MGQRGLAASLLIHQPRAGAQPARRAVGATRRWPSGFILSPIAAPGPRQSAL